MDSIYDPTPTEGDEVPTKKVRHRKKQFLQTIRKQMEFYFSDANLSKNRFLGQLVSKDPHVDLTIFLSFNKIRDLTTDVEDIKKSLKKSELLALTEDDTKVYRKTRVKQNDRADESTIYVEQLPPDADQDWLRSVFLPYGDVPYVSIPKYPHNGLNKGFAFVEFDCPESATKALEAFGAMGCRLTAEIPPEQICSIKQNIRCHRDEIPEVDMVSAETHFVKETDVESKEISKSNQMDLLEDDPRGQEMESKSKPVKKRKISFDDDPKPEEKSMNIGDERRSKKMKGKKDMGEAEDTECEKKKLKKVSSETEENETETHTTKSKVKTGLVNEEDKSEETLRDEAKCSLQSPEREGKAFKKRKLKTVSVEEKLEDSAKHSKKRRKEIKEESETDEPAMGEPSGRDSKDNEKENEGNEEVRKKKKSRHHKKKSRKEKPEPEPKMNLRVLSKFEWKRLRNKYLDLQKVKMTQLKQHLYRSRWGSSNSQDNQHHGNSSQEVNRRDNQRRQEEIGTDEAKPEKSEKKFTFVPGVIVHVRLSEPPADLKKFKNDAKANPEVKYVDVQEGWNEAFVRCSTAEAANQMVAQKTWSQMDVLTGVEESAYWEKMNRDREVKCGRNERVKVRGKTKLLAKVEKAVGKHIRFTTEEENGPKG